MDDYYELLDVAPDAERDDIRSAYRAKRDDLSSQDGDQNRAEVAKLNRAWNVLSDPAQRDRYDERLAQEREAAESDDDDEYEYDDDDADDDRADRSRRTPARTRAEQRAEMRRARVERKPTIALPEGLTMAPTRARLSALGFDIAVLLLIFVGCQLAGVKIIDSRYPRQSDRISAISDEVKVIDKKIDAESTKEDAANTRAEAAAKSGDSAAEETAKRAASDARAAEATEKKQRDRLVAENKKLNNELKPATTLIFAGSAVLLLLYLVPATALTGQTIGKRLRGIRVVKLDGSVAGWSGALTRFGLPLMVAVLLSPILGPLSLAVVLIGMVGWVSNPNRQGLHDRLAKTIVVEA
jgi:curved DNA-binding protein CbpA